MNQPPAPLQRVSAIPFPQSYSLPAKPEGAASSAQDAHRQTTFLLSEDLRLFEEGMNLQLRIVRDASASAFRKHPYAALMGLWSRTYLALADVCELAMRGSYASCPPLVRAACEYVAAQHQLHTSEMELFVEWLAGHLTPNETHKAFEFGLGHYFAGETLAVPIEKRPPIFFVRVGPAAETLAIDYRGSGGARASQSLTSAALLMGWEFKLFGPITLDATFSDGNVDSVDIKVRDGQPLGAEPRGTEGDFRFASLALAYRMSHWDAFTWSAGAGRFGSWAEYKTRGGESSRRDHTVNVRGVHARVTAEYVFGNGVTLGLFVLRGIGKPQGTDIDAAKRAGFKPKDADLTIVALTVGGQF